MYRQNKVSFVVSILRMSTTVNVMLIFIYHYSSMYTIYGYMHKMQNELLSV